MATVQKLNRGEKRYLARLFLGHDANGKRKEITKAFALKKPAEAWLREQQRLLERGEWVAPTPQTTGTFLDNWIATALKLGPQRERTKGQYRRMLELHVMPKLGGIPLQRLTTQAIEGQYATLLVSGGTPRKEGAKPGPLSATTVRRVHAAFHYALETAVRHHLIPRNPAEGAQLPGARESRGGNPLDGDGTRKVLDSTLDDPRNALWTLLLFSGMRPGEALALRWMDVDLEGRIVRVQGSLTWAKGAKWEITPPKTAKSRRIVPLVIEARDALTRQRDRQVAERLAAGKDPQPTPECFVFSHPDGRPLRGDVVGVQWKAMLGKLGLGGRRLYDARHTTATLALHASVPIKAVSDLLGHSSAMLTLNTYQHATRELVAQATDALALYLAPKPKQEEAQTAGGEA